MIKPGSVSYRCEDDYEKSALYAVIEDGEFELRAVEYDRTPLIEYTLDMAKNGRMEEHEMRVAFFFYSSCLALRQQKDMADNIRIAEEDLRKFREGNKK